jgi:hypothetical protein
MASEQDCGDEIERELRDVISLAFGRYNGMVTKFIVLVEAFGVASDGVDSGVGLWKFTSEGLHAWDTQGMLAHALTLMEAQVLKSDE